MAFKPCVGLPISKWLSAISLTARPLAGSTDTSLRFVQRLRAQCAKLAVLPGTLGRPRDEVRPGIRSFAYRGYIILFRYEADCVRIVSIV
jgi:plasmid stabilization system protein ParE